MTALAARPAGPVRTFPPWPARRPLRAWQQAALATALAHNGDSFLASATPAAGKTTFGLRVAHELMRTGRVARVAVVAPTTHICRQWAEDAARYGIDLEPNRPNSAGAEPRDRHGVAVTYGAIAAGPKGHGARAAARPTLLIADEPHHMGEHAAWGLRARTAFDGAVFRLLLSGTPFRSDNSAIPWVRYDDDGVSSADWSYGYAEALRDEVCRPVAFLTYDGDMEWSSGGRVRQADFGVVMGRAESARRLRTALAPDGDWMGHVLGDADARLSEVRAAGHRDAGGLVVAIDKEHARALAARLERVCGERPAIVTSDDPGASAAIGRFAAGTQRWLVSVLMVSEGVDVPRLRVGVYATAARTELFFRQVVGRFVRRTPAPAEQTSHVFLPSDPELKRLAALIEEERRHALVEKPGELGDEEAEPPERAPKTPGETFAALSSSARPDEAILVAPAPDGTLSLFPTAAPPPPTSRHLEAFGGPLTADATPAGAGPASFAAREDLRAERSRLVAKISRRTGEQHRAINARLNRATGASSVSKATLQQLVRANELLARELG